MSGYLLRRVVQGLITIFLISIMSFVIIQAPPGDFASTYVARISESGMSEQRKRELLDSITHRYGLDQPVYVQYGKWMWSIVSRGDFGVSFNWDRPVSRILGERLPLTFMISLLTLVFQLLVAIPIGIYTAMRRYTIGDYTFTLLSFLGLSVPHFLLALLVMVFLYNVFGISIGGLYSPEYRDAPWTFAKALDLLQHLIVPIVVIGLANTAATVRILRGTVLDELGKDYMKVLSAKGMAQHRAVFKHAARIAMNPVIAAFGWQLPLLVSGEVIVAIVIGLPTVGPVLFEALQSQDMYLAGGIILMVSALTVLGTLISDVLLAMSDPRISYGGE